MTAFNSEELNKISELDIVPVPNSSTPTSTGMLEVSFNSPKLVAPSRCFLDRPDESKLHHHKLFTFVNFGSFGNGFLKTCGAKANPDCADIVNALLNDAQGYLETTGDCKKWDSLDSVSRCS